MIDTHQLSSLNLEGVTISAQIDADGTLSPVEGGFNKLLAAAQEKALPRIHTVVVHPNQKDVPPDLSDSHAELRVFKAWTLEEAIQRILVDEQTRWGDIPDFREVLYRYRDFVGREWLTEQIETAIQRAVTEQGPTYILITGTPGAGKSAFVAHQVSRQAGAVYHFIRRGEGNLDDPEVLLNSLTAQLRRNYALPLRTEEHNLTTIDLFHRVLKQVSRKLEKEQYQTIWVDGLDEAFGPLGRFSDRSLSEFIPLNGLPKGIVLILTSRPGGEHLNWLDDPEQFFSISIDAQQKNSQEDIRAYLMRQNESLALGLSPEFLNQLVEASEGCFVAAVRYLYPNPHLKDVLAEWQLHPETIPKGLSGWLNWQWQWLLKAAKEQNIPERALCGVLGYLAVTDEKERAKILFHFLSGNQLEEYWDRVLQLSSELVERVQARGSTDIRYGFFHPHFAEFIWEKVKQHSGKTIRDSEIELPVGYLTGADQKQPPAFSHMTSSEQNIMRRKQQVPLIVGIVLAMVIVVGGGVLFKQLQQNTSLENPPNFATAITSSTPMPINQAMTLVLTRPTILSSPFNPAIVLSSTPEVLPTPTPTFQAPAQAEEFLDGVQAEKLDSFDASSEVNWDLGTIGKISNGVLELTGDEINWNQIWLKRSLLEGEGVLFLTHYTRGAEFDMFMQSGPWQEETFRRFGINGGGKPTEHVWFGKQYTGDFLSGNFSPEPDHWYYVLMAIDNQANGVVAIWDPEHPEQQNFYKKEMGEESRGQYWGLGIEVFRGTVQIDNFYILSFDSIR